MGKEKSKSFTQGQWFARIQAAFSAAGNTNFLLFDCSTMYIWMQYLHLKIVKNMQIYRKCTEAPPFRAISGGASRRKGGHRGQYSLQ